MAANHINLLLKQALTTFTCKQEIFRQQLDKLKVLFDQTTACDVNFPKQFLLDSLWNNKDKAPATYIDIYDDNILTMAIFILKPNMKLPLHDHPQMYGLIKVIGGTVKITNYTICNSDRLLSSDNYSNMYLTAERCNDIIADEKSESCILEPTKRNIHEIESVGGPAAFLDILSPPYESDIPNFGPRKCSYFKVVKEVLPCIYHLEEINSPSWYWNDSFPYTGPPLK